MIKRIFTGIFVLLSMSCLAQHVPLETIADSTLGWMKVYNYKGTPKPLQSSNRTYSSEQLKNCDLFVNWMQQSYLPKGWPGDARRTVNEEPTVSSRGERLKSEPQCYGAYAKFYTILKKDSQGKIVQETGDAVYWNIIANDIDIISLSVQWLSTSDQYYFTLPGYKKDAKQDLSSHKAIGEREDFFKHPVLNKYIHYYLPKHYNNTDAGSYYVVLLTKNNQPPWSPVTKATYFQKMEENLNTWYKKELSENARKNQAYPKKLANENASANNQMTQAKAALERLKEKYKNRMQEPAELAQWGNQADLWINEGMRDMFDTDNYTTYPVYTISKETMSKCSDGQPQWIAIYWQPPGEGYSIEQIENLHTSILNNFNFQYVYDHFFGDMPMESYKPLRSPTFKEVVAVTEASATSKKSASDKSIFFFDDFSTTAVNNTPSSWSSSIYAGKKATVAEPDGVNGKWLGVKGNTITVTQLKKPFPKNFEITFDVAVPQNFTWGGKRLELFLEGTNAKFSLAMRPGYNGREGDANIRGNLGKGDIKAGDFLGVPGFSNNKKVNPVKVTIKKAGESLQVFIDKSKIYEVSAGVPDNTLFTSLKFSHGRSDGETERYFISNIQIIEL